jgi:hypothetical protein
MTANRSPAESDDPELEVIEFLKLHDDTTSRDHVRIEKTSRDPVRKDAGDRYFYEVEAKFRYGIVLRWSAGRKRVMVWCLSKQNDRGGEKGRKENKRLGQIEGLGGCSYLRDDPWEIIWISVNLRRKWRGRLDRRQTKDVWLLAEQLHGSRPAAGGPEPLARRPGGTDPQRGA